jgi:hypothetical protein
LGRRKCEAIKAEKAGKAGKAAKILRCIYGFLSIFSF